MLPALPRAAARSLVLEPVALAVTTTPALVALALAGVQAISSRWRHV
jgi:hypothetical protein